MAYQRNYYAVLGLPAPVQSRGPNRASPRLEPKEIKSAYRRALLRWHPDKVKAATATAAATVLQAAEPEPEPKPERGLDGSRAERDLGAVGEGRAYSVDEIVVAYSMLKEEGARREVDRWLLAQRGNGGDRGGQGEGEGKLGPETNEGWYTGLEVVDLDDLVLDGAGAGAGAGAAGEEGRGDVWYRSCRCGSERGFVVTEEELAAEEERGGREVLVGCVGCSLWLRVGFGVVGGEEGDTGG
ncbi:hypothetical protein K432DRAFT_446842 [Lepidopterella palustris CBS 459.81]|uniref:Diphthamide biosynthesis protein 4 n=1 Tax=Lepidopterella palustris CBS 459.81 TaxID=1314670 RepID=A0A8E2E0N1_9PEZI|nr:hypothetical protein K432DRAFT_446842 [Lepidopterella palustris CBS 459.81]